ncbi:MAG: TIGR03013 family PEP-CTERM/XrtA system glycosyltransferase [Desulfovibrio sp.]|nr:TIGR03013 family PEP-CTERM/XrtA system glycosyltransferase [Desulfovibrio sp.]
MNSNRLIIFRLLDLACILTALKISSGIMLPDFLEIFSDYTGASTFTVIIMLLSFYMLDCYAVGREELRDSIVRVVVALAIGVIAAGFTFYSFEHWRFPRIMFVVQMLVNLGLSLGWRSLYFWFSRRYVPMPEKVIFIGAGMEERARRVLSEYQPEAQIFGYVGEAGADIAGAGPCLGPADRIFSIIERYRPTRVIVLDSFYLDQNIAHGLFAAKLRGLKVDDMRGLYERLASRLPVDLIGDEWLLLENGFNINPAESLGRFKRAFDVCFASTLLLVTSPLLLLVVLCVRLESPGPVVYRQKRVGLRGEEFTLYKVRSMRRDAEKNGAVWASKDDPRVTRVGKCIRKTRLDELPQLINVLKGDMSVIGPRPERMDFVKELVKKLPYYDVRHSVRPGITGWAQVCYPYGASLEDSRLKLEYDLFYIKHLSVLLEVKILLRTIGVILFPKGAR